MKFKHDGGAIETVYPEDFLVKKTFHPLGKGDRVQGRLFFTFSELSPNDLRAIGTKYVLEFYDLWNRRWKADFVVSGERDVVYGYPGIRAPVTPSPTPSP